MSGYKQNKTIDEAQKHFPLSPLFYSYSHKMSPPNSNQQVPSIFSPSSLFSAPHARGGGSDAASFVLLKIRSPQDVACVLLTAAGMVWYSSLHLDQEWKK